MKTIEYRTVDKTDWQRGPWDDEPDKKQWQDEATGLACLIVRGPSGALCGYVGLPVGHPLHSKDEERVDDISVHGGLTYSGPCTPGADEARGVCHVVESESEDHVWWLGFDCAHSYDIRPAHLTLCDAHPDDRYRCFAYVTYEVTSLALQLSQVTASV